MKYILFTYDGHALPIAHHLQLEGQDVLVAQVQDRSELHLPNDRTTEEAWEKERRLALFNGILEKKPAKQVLRELQKIKHPNDYFVFFDLQDLYWYADQVAQLGFPGNFPTKEDYLLEADRDKAKQLVDKFYPDLKAVNPQSFKRVAEAKAFLNASDDLWVLKGNEEKAPTIVPDVIDPELAKSQLIQALEDKQKLYEAKGFIFEELITKPIELTPEKIYYDGQPIATTLDIENKPLGSGNISVQTGCAADMVFNTHLDDKINTIAFPAFVDELAKKHKGLFIWDASILIDGRTGKLHFGEFCSNRPGYNALFTEMALAGSVHRYFEAVIKGRNPFAEHKVAVSVRLFNLYQDEAGRTTAGGRILYDKKIESDLWLWDVQKRDDELVAIGMDKNLAVMTAANNSVTDAINKVYRNIDLFSFEGAYYRPKFDYLSTDYPTAILNRLNYGLERGLYKMPFAL